jgi:peptidoglycan/LPS O-acetylase OafA/YrhL
VIGYQPSYGVAFFASVILAALFFQTVVTEKGWFSSFLSTKPLQFWGKISYSLYLCGGLAAIPSRYVSLAAHHRLSGTPSLVAAFVVGTLTIVPICWVCYELFEVRLTRFLFPKKLPA